jgi:hypothetical protein
VEAQWRASGKEAEKRRANRTGEGAQALTPCSDAVWLPLTSCKTFHSELSY